MTARSQCVSIVQQILEKRVFFGNLKSQIPDNDRAFCNMLVLTVLRRLTSLQQILDRFIRRKIPNKHKILYMVLYCACAEMLYMETPVYAVINEYVSVTKRLTDKFCGGMVNAVLRKIAACRHELLETYETLKFPAAFAQILEQDYTPEQISNMELMLKTEPPLDLSAKNADVIRFENMNTIHFANGSIRLTDKNIQIHELPNYHKGLWWVQDLASSLPVHLLGDVSGKKVLDICAAPGGKTAQLLAKGAKVTAVDIDAERMKTLEDNIRRLNLSDRLQTVVCDGVDYLQHSTEIFDIIIADVPCSGTGTFRRHPEIIHIKTKEDVAQQLCLQQAFLNAAGNCLKPQGLLLYCTCSVAKEEGEKQIAKFLRYNQMFELYPLTLQTAEKFQGILLDKNLIDKGVLRTLPYYMSDKGGMDAFFAACLQKKQG